MALLRDVSGINTAVNLDTTTKGTNLLNPINFGLGFDKNGYQVGVTGTIPNITAPAVSNTLFHLGWAGCPHMNVSFFYVLSSKNRSPIKYNGQVSKVP